MSRPRRSTRLPVAAVGLLTAGAVLAACGSSSSGTSTGGGASSSAGGSTSRPNLGIGYFQGNVIGPESIVAANTELSSKVDANIKLTPINSGVAGLAELRGGAFPAVSGVGNPPVVGAIANGTKIKVVYAEYLDAAQLIVKPEIKTNDDLAGKKIADLTGSSEDFEIRGWLKTQGLDKKVEVVGFASEAAAAAAYKSGAVAGAYVELGQAFDLTSKGGRKVTDAQEIAKLGYPSLNILAVTDDFAAKNKPAVQQLVCQTMRAQAILTGPSPDAFISKSAKLVGAPEDLAKVATKVIPWIKGDEELGWFHDENGNVSNGKIAKAYALTADFLKEQGRVTTIPTADQIANALDSSYVEQAIADKCNTAT
jgi:taurine transport system substrate-binding protein